MCIHVMSSVEKLMMVGMKLSRMRMVLMDLQSVVGSPINRQMLSIAILTAFGGLASERTSTNCCFLIDLTAAVVNREFRNQMLTSGSVLQFRTQVGKY